MFLAIADTGSFSAAAAHLGLTPSAVSKAVTRAERRLGVRLLHRTTHRLAFTDAGGSYLERGRSLIAELAGLERETASRDELVRGVLRVSAPTVYGALHVVPVVAALHQQHSELAVHLWCDDRLVDVIAERIDVAVRIVAKPPPDLVARELDEDRRGLYASSTYLHRTKPPKNVDDLAGHSAITYSGGTMTSQLHRARVVLATDNILAAREAARASLGIAELPAYLAADDVAAGHLREVLPGAIPVTRKLFALYPPSRFIAPKVRALVDALVAASRRR